ncbi:Chromosomal replication initiator protein DnaA [Labilithrix luteola]|uniref:Chromosomal replication initiator protein DnaA n=1 Tax=Labilithrix luteola TaxID=1391654 RepID=A0A0K1PWR1_9BACT|nr:chromosomal replication initiator protein DnaA [Labilithrix luteola]AKU97574.1 Chromosomal replication initiator protein DnaA [Labilithrix luteola]
MEMQHDTLWNEAVAFTRAKSPASFEQWFSGVQFDGMTDGIVSLRARDEFVREWVDQHFLPTLVDYLRSQTGWSVQVAWSVGGHLERPVAFGVPVSPVRPRALVPDSRRFSQGPATYNGSNGSNGSDMRDDTRLDAAANYARAYGVGDESHEGEEFQSPASRRPPPRMESRPEKLEKPVTPPPLEGLNPKYTFGNFVVGPSNQLAHAAAIAAAGGGGPRHNPLFLCGGTGLGKTHLVHAVAHRVREERPSSRILYVSAEKFVNEFVQSLQEGRMNEFRSRYRDRCDLLLVDDIQFLASKTQTQEEFFHAFNALHQGDKQIIVTSDKYPQQLERMEERLVSRFSWGLVADIQGPELETRVAILRKKAQMEQIELEGEVVLYLAQTIRSNVRELEGTLIRLAAKSSLLGRQIDLDFARQELAATAGPRASEAGVDDIQRVVCHHFKLRTNDLLSKDRHKSIAFARHVAMYLCKQRLKCSFPELGRAFGNRDHTTVMSAVRKVEHLRASDPEVRAHLEALERKLGTND